MRVIASLPEVVLSIFQCVLDGLDVLWEGVQLVLEADELVRDVVPRLLQVGLHQPPSLLELARWNEVSAP